MYLNDQLCGLLLVLNCLSLERVGGTDVLHLFYRLFWLWQYIIITKKVIETATNEICSVTRMHEVCVIVYLIYPVLCY